MCRCVEQSGKERKNRKVERYSEKLDSRIEVMGKVKKYLEK